MGNFLYTYLSMELNVETDTSGRIMESIFSHTLTSSLKVSFELAKSLSLSLLLTTYTFENFLKK